MGLPEAAPSLFAWYTPGFSDALGDRLLLFDNTEDRPLELLRLSPAIAAAPEAESLLRLRTQALATLDDDRFARVCRVDRLPQPGGGLAIVSEHIDGQRLSEFLTLVSQRGGRVGADLTISVVSKLVTALGVLHRRGPDLAHGALAPERLVVAPGGRVVITEHVLAPVLQELSFDRDALWQRLRLALPPAPAPVAFVQQADLFQVGFVALAMLFGRPLHADEDPSQAGALLHQAAGRAREAGWEASRWQEFERWLSRALRVAEEDAFADTVEAGLALASLTDASGRTEWERAAVAPPPPALRDASPGLNCRQPDAAGLLIRQDATVPGPDAAAAAERHQSRPGPEGVASSGGAERQQSRPGTTRSERRSLPINSPALQSVRRNRRRKRTLVAAGAALVLALPGVYLGARGLLARRQPAAAGVEAERRRQAPGPVTAPAQLPPTLDVRSDPPGARVLVDGRVRGVTPITVTDLPRGEHVVRLETVGRSVTQAVVLEPTRTATLFVPFRVSTTSAPPQKSPGWLAVVSPIELNVYEDGDLVGTSRSGRIMLSSGTHSLSLANEAIAFKASREVEVAPGETATLEISVPNGRADINAAPWAEVWIDGAKAGDTPLAGFVLAPGRHTVTFRHPRLGERSVDCFVTLQEPLRVSADLTK